MVKILKIFIILSVWSLHVQAKDILVDSHPEKFELSLQEAVLDAKSGDKILIPKGIFYLTQSISMFNGNIMVQGAGPDKTILDFSRVMEGAQAVLLKSKKITLDGFSILNSPGDGVVARGVREPTLRNLRVDWPNGKPGGYGVYPTQCLDALIEHVEVNHATEAGVYVGQTRNALIRHNKTRGNVVGIDIENSSLVEVYSNTVIENSVGITVTGRPYLVAKNSKDVKIFNNVISGNNHKNFAAKGSFAFQMGEGIGVRVVAATNVTISNNTIKDHSGADVYISDFDVLDRGYKSDSQFSQKSGSIRVEAKQFKKTRVMVLRESAVKPSSFGRLPVNVMLHGLKEEDKEPPVCLVFEGEEKNHNISIDGLSERVNLDSLTCEKS